mmetsp:Transcript_14520/g.24805  ORF Transcript_14520/g.24805 Transcript_14520/m.24805 type:complete len:187 (-) Transcript_14520:16-576(-)
MELTDSDRCFRASLHREGHGPWGIQVAVQPGSEGLVISSIHFNSEAVKQWNLENPRQLVESGVVISEINGRRDVFDMILQMRSAQDLELLISRDLTPGQQQALTDVLCTHAEFEEVTREVDMNMGDGEHQQCSICLDEMDCTAPVVELRCAHRFHRTCLQKWLLCATRCPLCNLDVKQCQRPPRVS